MNVFFSSQKRILMSREQDGENDVKNTFTFSDSIQGAVPCYDPHRSLQTVSSSSDPRSGQKVSGTLMIAFKHSGLITCV